MSPKLTSRQLALAQAETIEDCNHIDIESVFPSENAALLDATGRKSKKSELADHEQLADFALALDPTHCVEESDEFHHRLPLETHHSAVSMTTHMSSSFLTPTLDTLLNEKGKGTAKRNYRRSTRQKWTLEETNDLKAGVALCGVGRWKDILEHPRFHFKEERTHVDLKDKFRTLFPPHQPEKWAKQTEKVSHNKSDRRRQHGRKKTQSQAPYRIWTDDEDARLAWGFEMHGFRWKAIAQDGSLRLGHRRPDQLRDRFRRRHADKYEKPSGVSKLMLPKKQQGRPRKSNAKPDKTCTYATNEMGERKQYSASPERSEAAASISSADNDEDDEDDEDDDVVPSLRWNDMAVQPMFDL